MNDDGEPLKIPLLTVQKKTTNGREKTKQEK